MTQARITSGWFQYNGVRSDSMGIKVESRNVFGAPKYDAEFIAVPGRDGELINSNRRFSNVQITYTVFVPALSMAELTEKMTAVKAWLYTEPDRYHELRDSEDTEAYRMAVINTQLDITQEVNRIGRFTVSFSCLPYRYLLSGTEKRTLSAAMRFVNPYPFTAKPFITVIGAGRSGTVKFTHGGEEKEWTINGVNGRLDIDSAEMIVTMDGAIANDRLEGDGFPVFEPGATTVSFSGAVTSMEITPRWVTL